MSFVYRNVIEEMPPLRESALSALPNEMIQGNPYYGALSVFFDIAEQLGLSSETKEQLSSHERVEEFKIPVDIRVTIDGKDFVVDESFDGIVFSGNTQHFGNSFSLERVFCCYFWNRHYNCFLEQIILQFRAR